MVPLNASGVNEDATKPPERVGSPRLTRSDYGRRDRVGLTMTSPPRKVAGQRRGERPAGRSPRSGDRAGRSAAVSLLASCPGSSASPSASPSSFVSARSFRTSAGSVGSFANTRPPLRRRSPTRSRSGSGIGAESGPAGPRDPVALDRPRDPALAATDGQERLAVVGIALDDPDLDVHH